MDETIPLTTGEWDEWGNLNRPGLSGDFIS